MCLSAHGRDLRVAELFHAVKFGEGGSSWRELGAVGASTFSTSPRTATLIGACQRIHFPRFRGRRPNAIDRKLSNYVRRVTQASTGSFRVAKASPTS